ncbi:hypothetical protein Droror1_Dr00015016 [Drosera rotundifolia]
MIQYLNMLTTIIWIVVLLLAGLYWKVRFAIKIISAVVNTLQQPFGILLKLFKNYQQLKHNEEKLQNIVMNLQSKETDLRQTAEREQIRTGKKLKQEVENWIANTEKILAAEQDLNIRFLWLYHRVMLRNSVAKMIQDIDALIQQARAFEETGLLSAERARLSVPETNFIGESARRCIKEIHEWASKDDNNDPNFSRILAVTGDEGVGKTAVVQEVYNRMQEAEANVYMIEVREGDVTGDELLKDIARAILGRDLEGEDERRRGILCNALKKINNPVLILDGLNQSYDLQKQLGIPIYRFGGEERSHGKLIITTRSRSVRREMGCQTSIVLGPLSDHEGEELFNHHLGHRQLHDPDIVVLKRSILRNCMNVPGKIIETAMDLRGECDIIQWITVYNRLELHRLRM